MKVKSILSVFPIMIYYLVESMLMSLVITPVWNKWLASSINMIELSWWEWSLILWIIKVSFFDIFKVINVGNQIIVNDVKEDEK
jgi:hypothetical protein